MKNQFVDFKAVRAAVSMNQLLDHYGLWDDLECKGDRVSGPCPIHHGSNATQFRVSLSRNCWNCFGDCGRGGNVLDFVSLMEGLSIREAALQIVDWFNLAVELFPSLGKLRGESESDTRESSSRGNRSEEKSDSHRTEEVSNEPLSFSLKLDSSHPYLKDRGLDDETIWEFGLGYCSRGMLRGYIAIPIHNADGELIAYAGRWPGNPPKGVSKYKLPKGFHKTIELFNLHRALKEPDDLPVVVVEGFFGCLALRAAGINRCVAAMGSSLSEAQAEILGETLKPGTAIEILFDEDKAGRKGREKAMRLLSDRFPTRIIQLPEDGMQPDDVEPDEIAPLFE